MKTITLKKPPRLTPTVVRAEDATRIELRYRESWSRMSLEERVRVLNMAVIFLETVKEQMADEIVHLLDGDGGAIDMAAEDTG